MPAMRGQGPNKVQRPCNKPGWLRVILGDIVVAEVSWLSPTPTLVHSSLALQALTEIECVCKATPIIHGASCVVFPLLGRHSNGSPVKEKAFW